MQFIYIINFFGIIYKKFFYFAKIFINILLCFKWNKVKYGWTANCACKINWNKNGALWNRSISNY